MEATARDRVWAAMLKEPVTTVTRVREEIEQDCIDAEPPSDATIRRTFRAAVELGVKRHEGNDAIWHDDYDGPL